MATLSSSYVQCLSTPFVQGPLRLTPFVGKVQSTVISCNRQTSLVELGVFIEVLLLNKQQQPACTVLAPFVCPAYIQNFNYCSFPIIFLVCSTLPSSVHVNAFLDKNGDPLFLINHRDKTHRFAHRTTCKVRVCGKQPPKKRMTG